MSVSLVMSAVLPACASNVYTADEETGFEESGYILFPGDTVDGIIAPVYYLNWDYETAYPIEDGSWTNTPADDSHAQAYRVTPGDFDEEGNLAFIDIVSVGYVLTVTDGQSRLVGDSFDQEETHYHYQDWSYSEEGGRKDVAYYQPGTQVTIRAFDAPEGSGLTFANWEPLTSNLSFDTQMLLTPEISFVMPDQSASISVSYCPAQAEVVPEQEVPAPEGDVPAEEQAAAEGTYEDPEAAGYAEMPADQMQDGLSDGTAGEFWPEGNPEVPEGGEFWQDPQTVMNQDEMQADMQAGWDQGDPQITLGQEEMQEAAGTVDAGNGADAGGAVPEEDAWNDVVTVDGNQDMAVVSDDIFNTDDSAFDQLTGVEIYTDQPAAADAAAEQPVQEAADNAAAEQPVQEAADSAAAEQPVQEAADSAAAEQPAQEAADSAAAEQPAQDAPVEVVTADLSIVHVEMNDGTSVQPLEDKTVTAEVGAVLEHQITAPDTPEGFIFTGWTAYRDADGIQDPLTEEELKGVLEDPVSSETVITVPAYDVTLVANYTQAEPAQEPAAEPTQEQAAEPEDGQTQPSGDGTQQPAGDGTQQPAGDETQQPAGDEAQQPAGDEAQQPATEQAQQPATEQAQQPATEQAQQPAAPAPAAPVTYTITSNVEGSKILVNGVEASSAQKDAEISVTVPGSDSSREFNSLTVSDAASGAQIATYSDPTAVFKMPEANIAISAKYTPIYKVTVKKGSGDGSYAAGDYVDIAANEAEPGWRFDHWEVTKGNADIDEEYSEETGFTMPDGAVKVKAVYVQIKFDLTVENGSGDGTYTMGTTVRISADWPASGKEFDQWVVVSGDPAVASPGRFYSDLTMPEDDVEVRATYKDGPNPANNAITGISPGGEYLKGSTITFSAVGSGMDNSNPNPGDYRYKPTGYRIGNVNNGWNDGKYTTSMAINAAGDYTLTVTFTKEIFDGNSWISDGTTDTKSVSFHVVNALSVQTGDSSPLVPLAIALVAALVIIIAVIVIKMRRRR